MLDLQGNPGRKGSHSAVKERGCDLLGPGGGVGFYSEGRITRRAFLCIFGEKRCHVVIRENDVVVHLLQPRIVKISGRNEVEGGNS